MKSLCSEKKIPCLDRNCIDSNFQIGPAFTESSILLPLFCSVPMCTLSPTPLVNTLHILTAQGSIHLIKTAFQSYLLVLHHVIYSHFNISQLSYLDHTWTYHLLHCCLLIMSCFPYLASLIAQYIFFMSVVGWRT